MARLVYLFKVLSRYIIDPDTSCPHCGNQYTSLIGRKHILLQLRKCSQCYLQFRYPKDTESINKRFYSGQYRELQSITTTMPSDNELSQVLSRGFVGSGKDFSERIAILKSYVSTGKLLDYGCSWGYGTWQIQRAGFETVGFEIDVTRAKYGRDKLGLNIYTGWDELRNTGIKYDILFTSHVLEHLPSLKRTFLDFNTILALQGLLLIFVPNCTGIETPQIFERKKSFAFGEKHTFAFTADFFLHNLPKSGFQIEQIDVTPHGSPKPTLVNGSELLVVARKQPKSI